MHVRKIFCFFRMTSLKKCIYANHSTYLPTCLLTDALNMVALTMVALTMVALTKVALTMVALTKVALTMVAFTIIPTCRLYIINIYITCKKKM